MSFRSYAQNFEDVILWRALKHIENGFYIDIGAYDPREDSVSLAFYERGWRGIHVEPVPTFAERIQRSRPDETVINAAISSSADEITLYVFENTGLTTGISDFALKHSLAGHTPKEMLVPTRTLSSVFEETRNADVHWLKIDVEGMELDVLESWGECETRPWIVVIESTLPSSPTENFAAWEGELVKRGYSFVYFDGLNRFYVYEQHCELKKYFGPGPNCFDGFSLTERSVFVHETAMQWRADKEKLTTELGETIATLRGGIAQLRGEVEQKEGQIRLLADQVRKSKRTISKRIFKEVGRTVRKFRAFKPIMLARAYFSTYRQVRPVKRSLRYALSLLSLGSPNGRLLKRMLWFDPSGTSKSNMVDVGPNSSDVVVGGTFKILFDAAQRWKLGKRIDA